MFGLFGWACLVCDDLCGYVARCGVVLVWLVVIRCCVHWCFGLLLFVRGVVPLCFLTEFKLTVLLGYRVKLCFVVAVCGWCCCVLVYGLHCCVSFGMICFAIGVGGVS